MHENISYDHIISSDNLLEAWKEFRRGKRNKKDVQEFEYHLVENIRTLHDELARGTYQHGPYQHFKINDPKPRDIHKALVRDRLLHHAIYRQLYPFFDRTFIADSYFCRENKGTHRAMNRFRRFAYQMSENNERTVWILKCDVRKFFASVDHEILLNILTETIRDEQVVLLLTNVIYSFSSTAPGKGLPLGNLTSQLLVNIYMNEFDQFAKHTLKAEQYIRYADDFVIFSQGYDWLTGLLPQIRKFLHKRLKLELHPDKVSVTTLASGVDFLGWVHFFDHRVFRTSTKRRMLRAMTGDPGNETIRSYRSMLKHGNAYSLSKHIPQKT